MCGRAVLTFKQVQEVEQFLSAEVTEEFSSLLDDGGGYHNYNIPPTSVVPICSSSENGRRMIYPAYWWFMKWPKKDGKPNFSYSTFNARADKLQSGNLWKSVISDPSARCIIPFTGYYEFSGSRGNKTPHYFYPIGKPFFAAAGLFSPISPNSGMRSFTVITTTPNEVQKPIHDRMPALLLPEEIDDWLNPSHSTDYILDLIKPFPDDAMDTHIVSQQINNAKNNHPGLLQRADLFN